MGYINLHELLTSQAEEKLFEEKLKCVENH